MGACQTITPICYHELPLCRGGGEMRGMRETDSHALLCVLIYFLEPFLGKYNHYITVLKVRELWDLSRTQAGARDGICPSVRGRLTDRED